MRVFRSGRVAAALVTAVAGATFFGTGLAATDVAAPDVNYALVGSVSLGAPDRWDYVYFDARSGRVYASHGDRVTVIDGRGGTILGQVGTFPGGTHGVVITPGGRGYTDDGRAGTASSFDPRTLAVTATIPSAEDADAIAYDSASGHVFVVNGDPGTLTVIDPKTNTVVATVRTDTKLEFAAAGGNGKLYVNGVPDHEVLRIDTSSNVVDAHWSMPECRGPHGLAVDSATHRVFSGCATNLYVLDGDNGGIVATLPIGRGSDAVAVDPTRHLVFSSNGLDGNITVIREIDAQHFAVAGTIRTAASGRTMTLDPASGRLYVLAAELAPESAGSPAASANGAPPGGRAGGGFGPRRPPVPGSLKLMIYAPP